MELFFDPIRLIGKNNREEPEMDIQPKKACQSTGCLEVIETSNPRAKWCSKHRKLNTRYCKGCNGVIRVTNKGAVFCPDCGSKYAANRSSQKESRLLSEIAKRKAKRMAKAQARLDVAAAGISGGGVFAYGRCEGCNEDFMAWGSHVDGLTFTCSTRCQRRRNKAIGFNRRNVAYPHWCKVANATGSMDCWLCGFPTDPSDFVQKDYFIVGPEYPSVDHIIPVSKGGTGEMTNLKIAHMMCNSLRGDSPAKTFLAA